MSAHDPESMYDVGGDEFGRDLRRKVADQAAEQSVRPMTRFRVQNRLKLTSDPTWIRLIPENHPLGDGRTARFFDFVEHFYGSVMRGTICSKIYQIGSNGKVEGSGKCLPCYYRDERDMADKISARPLTAFLMLHYEWHYLIPSTDKDGKVRTYQENTKYCKKGDPVMDRVLESEALEKYGRRKIERRGYERVFGKLTHMALGKNHLATLSTTVDDLENLCACGGEINVALWECPKCAEPVYDMTSAGDCDLTPQQAKLAASKRIVCPACGKKVFLYPVRDCDKCKDPSPLRIWDVDLYVSKTGQKAQTQLVIRRHRVRPIDERCKDMIPENPILHRVYASDSLKYQAKTLRLQNPWLEDDARRRIQDYDDNDAAAADDIPV